MKVTIRPKHFRKATCFIDNKGCPLYQTLSEILPDDNIWIGENWIRINGKEYDIKGWTNFSGATIEPLIVNKYIDKAKNHKKVPFFEVEIVGFEPISK